MRRAPSRFPRQVALLAVICVLGIAAGCGRESFNLLAPDAPPAESGAPGAGQPNTAGASGGTAGAATSGSSSTSGSANAGFGGHTGGYPSGGYPSGGYPPNGYPSGGTGDSPCFGEGGCPDEPRYCPLSSPFCMPCKWRADCADGDKCDPELKLCVQCRVNSDCPDGEGCHPLTRRCRKECEWSEDCRGDSQHLLCARDVDLCVSCNKETDCAIYPDRRKCFVDTCVECFDYSHCQNLPGQACIAGRCLKR